MSTKEFGQFLRQLRKEKELTVRKLAELSNVSQSYITNLENNKRGVPSYDVLKKLSEALELRYSELLYRAGYFTEEEYEVYRKIEARSEAIYERLKKVIDLLSTNGKFRQNILKDLIPIFNNDQVFSGYQFGYVFIFDDIVEKLKIDPEHDISDFLDEFQKYYNTDEVKNLLKYATDDFKEDTLKKLEKVAIKHNLLESNTNDLVEFLRKENLTYKDHPINDYHLNLITSYLDVLFQDKT
ncbi:helix-turn-helix transcriptional regulator [Neobacillus niacini]|uniref:helix-turn-helix domain-containing protein n=1 Tax=Neobacillus niacini TaxID=86668 RepID=UPI003000928A